MSNQNVKPSSETTMSNQNDKPSSETTISNQDSETTMSNQEVKQQRLIKTEKNFPQAGNNKSRQYHNNK